MGLAPRTSRWRRGDAFHTAPGHAAEAWDEPRYREHVFTAIEWDHARSDATAG